MDIWSWIPSDTYLNDKLASFFKDYKYRLKDYEIPTVSGNQTRQAIAEVIAYFTHTSKRGM